MVKKITKKPNRASKPLVVHIAAECTPFIKVGGLADVVGSLPQALPKNLQRVVILPLPQTVRRQYRWKLLTTVTVPLDISHHERVSIYTLRHSSDVVYYGLQHSLFDDAIYSVPTGITVAEKFAFFSLAAVTFIADELPQTQLVHCHDWHTALVPTFLDAARQTHHLDHNVPSVFTIHNIAYQGLTPKSLTKTFKLKVDQELALMEDYHDNDQLNLMKIGILSADKITTVSPRYARELLTVEQPGGLSPFIKRRKKDLVGIINGIDTDSFNPATDSSIAQHYTKKTWHTAKVKNASALRKKLHLPQSSVPIIGLIGRLVEQKGLDILLPALEQLLPTERFQCVIIGTGDKAYEEALQQLAQKFPRSLAVHIGFDDALARQLYAGADCFLMPSRFEPCGLGQLISMRYATVPIVRATGGLADTVKDKVNGIVFKDYTTAALIKAIKQTLNLYQKPQSWYTMVNHGLATDVSWQASARDYYQLYQSLL
jgi:starch synthase